MLSCSKIRTTTKSAHSYYSADDYYSQSQSDQNQLVNNDAHLDKAEPNIRVPSFWYGNLAKDLGLAGEIDGEILDNLTKGILPNGQKMQGKVNEKQEEIHDAGRDLTFSAPKSVSILSEVLGLESLRQIHNTAVTKTLDHIQQNYSYTRTKVNGKIVRELTGNLIFGAYTHNTSRELDPQLHTHCVALNLTQRNDGKYRTVLFDPIFDDYKLLGLIYRSNLAFGLQESGFATEITDFDQGFFEIRGFPKEVLNIFSSRRQQIENKIKELGLETAKSKGIVALLTREGKVDIADHLLKEDWNSTLKEILKKLQINLHGPDIENNGQNLDKIFRTSLQKNWQNSLKESFENIFEEKLRPLLKIGSVPTKTKNNGQEFVIDAINSLSERESVFKEKDLVVKALKNGLGKVSYNDIANEIHKLKESKFLITGSAIGYINHLSTKDLLETELKIIEFVKDSLKQENKIAPIFSEHEFEKSVRGHEAFSTLKAGQQKAVHHILTSTENIIGIQGYAGTGKTHMLKIAAALLKAKDIEIFGLAPTGTAVKELESAGIKSKTLQWFLGKYDGLANGRGTIEGTNQIKQEFKNKIIVVDESSLISSRQMKDLLTIGKKLDLKIINIGDSKQLNAVEAGHPFYQMQKTGLKTVKMDEIVRQKNLRLRTAVYDTINASEPKNFDKNYIKKAFANLDQVIEIIPGKGEEPKTDLEKIKYKIELMDKIAVHTAQQFTTLDKNERDNCLILAPSNESRAKINHYIRETLKQSGELSNKTLLRNILVSQTFDEAQKANINIYQKDNILRFNKSYKTSNIVKDQYYQVLFKDLKKGNIHLLQLGTKKEVVWNPEKIVAAKKGGLEIYYQEKREFCVGEKINFTRGFIAKGITNSLSAEVTNITDKALRLKFDDKEIEFDKNDVILNHIDYGYGFTAHRAQGKTVDNVIAVLESYRPKLTNQKSFYVEISRARNNVTLILDNKEKVIKRLSKETGEKISAMDFAQNKQQQPSKDRKLKKDPKSAERKYLIPKFSPAEIKDSFLEKIKSHNFPSDKVTPALDQAFSKIGQKIRFGSKQENEVCWYGEAGYVKNYKTGEIVKWGVGNMDKARSKNFRKVNSKELATKQQKLEEEINHKTQLKLQEQAIIAKKAEQYFNLYPNFYKENRHNLYLDNKLLPWAKNLKNVKITKDNKIVIPIHDNDGKIHSLHYIEENGSKKFLKGGEKRGHFFLIQKEESLKNAKTVLLAEGFATAATLHQATGKPIVVCFDAGNIGPVLKNLREKYPEKQFVIAADNDIWKSHNTGKEKAEIAATEHGAKVILPQFHPIHKDQQPTDFNDLHKLAGIEEVKRQVLSNMELQNHISPEHQTHKVVELNF